MAFEGELKQRYNQAYQNWKEHRNPATLLALQGAISLILQRQIELGDLAQRAGDIYMAAMKAVGTATAVLGLTANDYELARVGEQLASVGITEVLYEIAVENHAKTKQYCDQAKRLYEQHSEANRSFVELISDLMSAEEVSQAIKSLK